VTLLNVGRKHGKMSIGGGNMDQEKEQQIMDNITKVCICRAITRRKIKDAIRQGADTVVKVSEKTGAMTGECRGRRCGLKIKGLLEEHQEGSWT